MYRNDLNFILPAGSGYCPGSLYVFFRSYSWRYGNCIPAVFPLCGHLLLTVFPARKNLSAGRECTQISL
ncbi:hypothetical protein DN748_02655 [Sinomicrobium soli]|nr:hypothetical protein DN748_02655 [Sinomicrobium sp. N-1-3-6]